MDDNATCHRTLAVQDCLDSEGIQRLVWPARSPDLNPIENVWDALGRQVAGRNYPPTNKNTLIRALTEEWDKLPQQQLDNVVQRRPRQTSRREDRHIVRNERVQLTASSAAIQANVAPSVGAPVSSRTKRRLLAEGTFRIAAPITCAALDAHPSITPLGVVPRTRKQDCRKMESSRLLRRIQIQSQQ
ncbi:transposable element Tcb1 transposase [Trichonephila clavipes]|nr:transposable element Tcb1 transposase [Trichonephila clavipes]